MFRSLANMICIVELFNAKRRKERYSTLLHKSCLSSTLSSPFYSHFHSCPLHLEVLIRDLCYAISNKIRSNYITIYHITSHDNFLNGRQLGTHGLPYERTNIMWTDILRIFSKLSEVLPVSVSSVYLCGLLADWLLVLNYPSLKCPILPSIHAHYYSSPTIFPAFFSSSYNPSVVLDTSSSSSPFPPWPSSVITLAHCCFSHSSIISAINSSL